MTAICPAGPPKLKPATRAQVQNASRKDTPWPQSAIGGEDARVVPAMGGVPQVRDLQTLISRSQTV